jgi:hypothetical protein
MKIVPVLIPIFALALAACGPEPRPADASGVARRDPPPPVAVLVAVPVLPHSRVVSATGTSEAVSTTLSAPYPPDSSAAWYRRALLARGWRLVGDLRAADGTLTIHAEREGPPLWIIVRKAPGGSELQVIGAVVDTSPPPVPSPARPAH